MAKIVTITNPLTGQPAQVDQLDHTAQQIDDGLNIARGVSNPNLLDNWYFGNPVDQRQGRIVKPNTTYYSDNQLTTSAGTTSAYMTAYRYATGTANGVSYASFKLEDSDTAPTYYAAPENVVRGYTGAGMTIDRWKLEDSTGNGVVLINGDGTITVLNPEGNTDGIWWTQFKEINFGGEQCTVSVLTTSATMGVLYFGSNNLGIGMQVGMTSLTGIPTGNVAARIVVSPGGSVTVKAAGLELGTQQTLAHQENGVWVLNEIPDYGEQLARCQRYQWITNADNNLPTPLMYAAASNTLVGSVQFPVTMRTKPAVTGVFARNVLTGETLSAVNNDSINVVTNQDGVCYIAGMFSPLTVGGWYQVAAIFDANL